MMARWPRRQPVPDIERRFGHEQKRGDRNDEHQQNQESKAQADEAVEFHASLGASLGIFAICSRYPRRLALRPANGKNTKAGTRTTGVE
jgi:hypothetical protein